MELLYKIALIYMIVDVVASLYVMVRYRKDLTSRVRKFLKPQPEYCCDDRWEFDECDCEEDDEELKPRMRRAIDKVFQIEKK